MPLPAHCPLIKLFTLYAEFKPNIFALLPPQRKEICCSLLIFIHFFLSPEKEKKLKFLTISN